MKKKTLITISIALCVFMYGISYSFASNNMAQDAVQGIRNVVGGAENVLEDTASGVVNGIKDATGATQNTASDVMGYAERNIGGAMTQDNNRDYTATRTATTANSNATLFGLNSTAWAWMIMAILGVVVVALVWYYGKQKEVNAKHEKDRY